MIKTGNTGSGFGAGHQRGDQQQGTQQPTETQNGPQNEGEVVEVLKAVAVPKTDKNQTNHFFGIYLRRRCSLYSKAIAIVIAFGFDAISSPKYFPTKLRPNQIIGALSLGVSDIANSFRTRSMMAVRTLSEMKSGLCLWSDPR